MAKFVAGTVARLLVGVCAGWVLACGGRVGAQGVPEILPRAEFIEEIRRLPGDVGPVGSLYVPESDSYMGNRLHDGHSVSMAASVSIASLPPPALNGPIMHVSGHSFNSGPKEANYANESVQAVAEVNYYFRVVAAPSIGSIPIILPLQWSVSLAIDNEGFGAASAGWEAAINPQINRFRGSTSASKLSIVSPFFGTAPVSESGVVNLKLNVQNYLQEQEYYRVHLELFGGASRYSTSADAGLNAAGVFDATLDPLPYVDPVFAAENQVEIFYSENIFQGSASVAAPEAGSLALIVPTALALDLMGIQGYRRRTRCTR